MRESAESRRLTSALSSLARTRHYQTRWPPAQGSREFRAFFGPIAKEAPVAANAVQFAVENTKKHYGDVLGQLQVIEIADAADPAAIAAALSKAGLANQLEASPQGFAFWNPDNAKYNTQSQPE